LGHRTKCTWT